jgi:hypothetical protein
MWWMIPFVATLLLVAALLLVGGRVAPFIYIVLTSTAKFVVAQGFRPAMSGAELILRYWRRLLVAMMYRRTSPGTDAAVILATSLAIVGGVQRRIADAANPQGPTSTRPLRAVRRAAPGSVRWPGLVVDNATATQAGERISSRCRPRPISQASRRRC